MTLEDRTNERLQALGIPNISECLGEVCMDGVYSAEELRRIADALEPSAWLAGRN